MTILEFIEKEIAMVKKKISIAKSKFTIKGLTYYHINEIKEEINILQDRLQVLQQIKSELEAWEVVKPSINEIKNQRCVVIHNVFRDKYYQIIKKALEVKDEFCSNK